MLPDLLLPIASALVLLGPLADSTTVNRLWYAAPLIVSISLVYAGTRHEAPGEIVAHAARFGGWVLVFMAIVTAALQIMWWLG